MLVRSFAIPSRVMFVLEERDGRFVETERSQPLSVFPMGSAAEEPFEQPIWGFDDQRSFGSTMTLADKRIWTRITELRYGPGKRSAAEVAELAELETSSVARSMGNIRDDDYGRYRRILEAIPGEVGRFRMTDYPNAQELDAQEVRKKQAMDEFLISLAADRDPGRALRL